MPYRAARATLPLAVLFCVSAAFFFVGFWIDDVAIRLVTKPIPVLCLAGWVALSRPGRIGWTIFAGLLLSVLGDVLLEIPADLFVFGLSAFLTAHLAYIGAALLDTTRLALVRALPVIVYCGVVYGVLFPGMGGLALPVGIYVTVIGAMLWRMAARVDGRPAATLALVGAISFALSDSVIAVRKFGVDFIGARELIMITYWGGQALIATSAVRGASERLLRRPAAGSRRPGVR